MKKTRDSVAYQIRKLEEMSTAVDDMFINVDKTHMTNMRVCLLIFRILKKVVILRD